MKLRTRAMIKRFALYRVEYAPRGHSSRKQTAANVLRIYRKHNREAYMKLFFGPEIVKK